MKYIKLFEDFSSEEDIEEKIKEVAKKIIHCGDYGIPYWNEKEGKIFWIAADSDDEDGGEYEEIDDTTINLTPYKEIERMFRELPFVKEFEIECESGPYDDPNYKEINYWKKK